MQWLLSLLAGTSGPLGWLATVLLNFFWGKVLDQVHKNETDAANHEANKAQAAQDVKKAKESKPDDEVGKIDEAIDDSLKHF
jgi:hypothetical protein